MEERLDWAMENEDWFQLFLEATLNNLVAATSDHSPIMLCTAIKVPYKRKHRFKFENSWLLEDELKSVVSENWCFKDQLNVLDRLLKCSTSLSKWGRKLATRFKEKIVQQKSRVVEHYRRKDELENAQVLKLHKGWLAKLLEQEEMFWKQRAKKFWLQGDDRNTRYFHASVLKYYIFNINW